MQCTGRWVGWGCTQERRGGAQPPKSFVGSTSMPRLDQPAPWHLSRSVLPCSTACTPLAHSEVALRQRVKCITGAQRGWRAQRLGTAEAAAAAAAAPACWPGLPLNECAAGRSRGFCRCRCCCRCPSLPASPAPAEPPPLHTARPPAVRSEWLRHLLQPRRDPPQQGRRSQVPGRDWVGSCYTKQTGVQMVRWSRWRW